MHESKVEEQCVVRPAAPRIDPARAPSVAGAAGLVRPTGLNASGVLQLQRLAGNRATGTLLVQQTPQNRSGNVSGAHIFPRVSNSLTQPSSMPSPRTAPAHISASNLDRWPVQRICKTPEGSAFPSILTQFPGLILANLGKNIFESEIRRDFTHKVKPDIVEATDLSISTLRKRAGMGLDIRSKAYAWGGQKPDIIHWRSEREGEWYEVKPCSDSGVRAGKKKVEGYSSVLSDPGLIATLKPGYDLRANGVVRVGGTGVLLHYALLGRGLIVYDVTVADPAQAAEKAQALREHAQEKRAERKAAQSKSSYPPMAINPWFVMPGLAPFPSGGLGEKAGKYSAYGTAGVATVAAPVGAVYIGGPAAAAALARVAAALARLLPVGKAGLQYGPAGLGLGSTLSSLPDQVPNQQATE